MERFTLLLYSSQQYKDIDGVNLDSQLSLTDVDECGAPPKTVKSFDQLRESSVYNSFITNRSRYVAYFDLDCLSSDEELDLIDNAFLCKWRLLSDDSNIIIGLNDKELVIELIQCVYRHYENCQSSFNEQCPISCLHELADFLSTPGTYLFEVVWMNFSNEFPYPEECLHLYGFLKRLQLWHKAKINLIDITGSNHQQSAVKETMKMSSLQAWKEAVETGSIPSTGKCLMLRYDVLWNGNLCLKNGSDHPSLLNGLQLKIKDMGDISQREFEYDCNWKVLLSNEIEVFKMIDESKIALHMLCPLNLQLAAINEEDNAMKLFISIAKNAWENNFCFLASIVYDQIQATRFDSTRYDTESWHEYITCKDTTCYEQRYPMKDLRRRCMMIIKGSSEPNSLDVYIVKDHSCLSGFGAYEYLTHEHSNNTEQGVTNMDIKWNFRLITKADIVKAELAYIEDIQNQLKGLQFKDIVPVDIFEKNPSAMAYLEKKEIYFELQDLNDVETNSNSSQSSCRPISPSKWPERIAWYNRGNNTISKSSLKRLQSGDNHMKLAGIPVAAKTSCNDAVKNLSELLDLFKDSGEALSEQLKPIPVVADRLLKQLPNEDFIKKLKFDEAVYYVAHGVEYCLDSQNALKLDAKLTRVQDRYISEDTCCTWTHIQRRSALDESTKSAEGDATCPNKNSAGSKSSEDAGENSEVKKKMKASETETLRRKKAGKEVSSSSKIDKIKDSTNKSHDGQKVKTKQSETRSQRHKRRLKIIVEATVEKYGKIKKDDKLFKSCVDRLFTLCKSFLKDLKSSEGLVAEMKKIAKNNVHQVVDFELRSNQK